MRLLSRLAPAQLAGLRWAKWLIPALGLAVVVVFLVVSDRLIDDLARQERERMQVWADATREIVNISLDPSGNSAAGANFDFLLGIIEGNRNIPVLLTDDDGNITSHRNFDLPEPADTLNPLDISPANLAYLEGRLAQMRNTPNVIDIQIGPGLNQHLYYEDSSLLRSLSWYPWVQVIMLVVFVAMVYYAVASVKKAEQNKVWVGLSKETAHQLGTPISSLMAWTELLPGMGVDAEVTAEMDKDVRRLATIASRFSKIGSEPRMEELDLNALLADSLEYMRSRVSAQVEIAFAPSAEPLPVRASAPLLEWVVENLVKNAVDAMEAHGRIAVVSSLSADGRHAVVTFTDTGKGIPRKKFKTIFNPGYTTKKRGWGLGLTLARRIVEQYHRGTIAVTASEPGVATTFRITLPLAGAPGRRSRRLTS